MLTEIREIDKIEVMTESKIILVREVIKIMRDDVEIARTYHRSSYEPTSDLDNLPEQVKAIAQVVWL